MLNLLRRIGSALLLVRRRHAVLPVVLWAGLIWLGSSMEGDPGHGTEHFRTFLGNLFHSFEFGILALWLLLLAPRGEGWARLGPGAACFVLGTVFLYAATDELHQSFVPGRDASYWDVLTDVVGASCVLWVVAYAGLERAREGGVLLRLGLSVLLCLLAAVLSTGPVRLAESWLGW